MGHGSVFVWVSGSWVTACDHCLLWSEAYEFQPVAVEVEATIFLSLSWGMRSRNTRATRLTVVTFSSGQVGMLIQRYNSILFHETLPG